MLVITGVDFSKIYDKVQNLKLSLSQKKKNFFLKFCFVDYPFLQYSVLLSRE